jgi:hypothetical protein
MTISSNWKKKKKIYKVEDEESKMSRKERKKGGQTWKQRDVAVFHVQKLEGNGKC